MSKRPPGYGSGHPALLRHEGCGPRRAARGVPAAVAAAGVDRSGGTHHGCFGARRSAGDAGPDAGGVADDAVPALRAAALRVGVGGIDAGDAAGEALFWSQRH